MKKHITLLFFSFCLTSCKKDITGHWHVKSRDNLHPYEFSIDIEKDNSCYLISGLQYSIIKGEHKIDEKLIAFPGDCGSGYFNYKIINNNLHLENYLGTKAIAKKEKCNRIDDYKTKLDIDFLSLGNINKDSLYNSDLSSINEYINIGYSKKNNKIMIESTSYSTLQTIDKVDSIPFKTDSYYRPYINYILTPDKNLKAIVLASVIKELTKNGRKTIFIRVLKNAYTSNDRVPFEYINIKNHQFNFKSEKNLKEIIN